MEICICDDEKTFREKLKTIVQNELQFQGIACTVKEYDTGNALLADHTFTGPDIAFLDIEMKGLDGMETARRMRKRYYNTVIIFVTVHPDYVFQGYDVRAFHYLLKPLKEEKLREVIRLAAAETGKLSKDFFLIDRKEGSFRIPLKEIQYFKSDRKKVIVSTRNTTEEFYGKLSDVKAELPEYFVRIHNRYLVNLNYVTKIGRSFCTCGDEELPVSRTYQRELTVAFARAMLN